MNAVCRSSLVCAALLIGCTSIAVGAGNPTATHREAGIVGVSGTTQARKITSFCVNADGNLLICDYAARSIKIVTPGDELRGEWQLEFAPQAICRQGESMICVAGSGKIARFDTTGKLLRSVIPADIGLLRRSFTGMCATDRDVFVACSGRGGYAVYRFDSDLGNCKQIITGLRGCCGQMDIAAYGGELYVAENGRHRVCRYDRDGKLLQTWGSRNRTGGLEGFGSCCNPMNICLDSQGNIYTSEARLGRVKCYTIDGRLVGLAGQISSPASCVRVTVELSRDGKKLFVLDSKSHKIRVLERR